MAAAKLPLIGETGSISTQYSDEILRQSTISLPNDGRSDGGSHWGSYSSDIQKEREEHHDEVADLPSLSTPNNIALSDDEENNNVLKGDDQSATVDVIQEVHDDDTVADQPSAPTTPPNNVAAGNDEENNILEGGGTDDAGVDEQTATVSTSIPPRSRVKHRHCKAAIMICVVWTITIVLISAALGMNLFDESDEVECTLCGDGLDLTFDSVWPTRQPSSSSKESHPPLDPPPSNLAELCAPSIHLDNGLSGDSIENCMRACLPALCCFSSIDEEAQDGLFSIIGNMFGLDVSDAQAKGYLSTIDDCYVGDYISVCDEYDKWCATLYSLDFVLEESLPTHFYDTCYQEQLDPVAAAEDDNCGKLCQPLECCYGDGLVSNTAIMRKRYRQHQSTSETESRRRAEEESCQHFNAQDVALRTQICDGYAQFCDPEYSTYSSLGSTSFEPSGAPTQMHSSHPSYLPSISISPSSTAPSPLAPTSVQPPDVNTSSSSYPTLFPTYMPTSYQTESFSRSNSPSPPFTSTKGPSSRPSTLPSGTPSYTNQPSTTYSYTKQPTAKVFVSFTSPNTPRETTPTSKPSTTDSPSETPSVDRQFISFSAHPSLSPSSPTSSNATKPTSSLRPTEK